MTRTSSNTYIFSVLVFRGKIHKNAGKLGNAVLKKCLLYFHWWQLCLHGYFRTPVYSSPFYLVLPLYKGVWFKRMGQTAYIWWERLTSFIDTVFIGSEIPSTGAHNLHAMFLSIAIHAGHSAQPNPPAHNPTAHPRTTHNTAVGLCVARLGTVRLGSVEVTRTLEEQPCCTPPSRRIVCSLTVCYRDAYRSVRLPKGELAIRFTWVRSWSYDCPDTLFCYQLIAIPVNKTATPPWPGGLVRGAHFIPLTHRQQPILIIVDEVHLWTGTRREHLRTSNSRSFR